MERITVQNAEKIKVILLGNNLDNKRIELEYKNIKAKVRIDSRSNYEKSKVFPDIDMKMCYLKNSCDVDEGNCCFEINGKKKMMYINIGEWGVSGGYKYRIENMHIALGVSTNKFGSSNAYFSQIEISQALEDNNYIYIVKNITNLSGQGAISRINSGLKSDKARKYERRDRLVKRLNSEVITYDNKEWMVINKINKEDLKDKEKYDGIFYELIRDIINYSFTIEDIIAEDKMLINVK